LACISKKQPVVQPGSVSKWTHKNAAMCSIGNNLLIQAFSKKNKKNDYFAPILDPISRFFGLSAVGPGNYPYGKPSRLTSKFSRIQPKCHA
jgi:hypothetical protein